MTEKDEKDSKVIPLFPGRDGGVKRGTDQRADKPSKPGPDDPEVLQEIQGILGEIESIPPPATDRPQAPEPGHRNAMRCPQCEQYTWRLTQHCIHCGADLVAYAEARAYRRRRRWDIIGRCIIVGSWFVAAGCFYGYNHYFRYLPPKVRGVMMLTGLGIVGVNLFVLWMFSEDDRRR